MRTCKRCQQLYPLVEMRNRPQRPYPLYCKPCARELDRETLLRKNGPLDARGETVLIKPWNEFYVVMGYKRPQQGFAKLNDAIHYACKTWCNFMLKTIDHTGCVAWEDHTARETLPRPSSLEFIKDAWQPPNLVDMIEINTPVWLPQGKG